MAFVARWNSRELFFLSTITLAVGVGYVACVFGLSMALGAFVAGLVVNESEYAHQALSDVVPLRDLFGMLFFVSVGMLLDPALRRGSSSATLALVVAAVVVGKAAILAGVVRAFGYWNVVPLAVGLTLFQVGEFAFVLARVGLSSGAISSRRLHAGAEYRDRHDGADAGRVGLVPGACTRGSGRAVRGKPTKRSTCPPSGLSDHVIIAGAGRVGRSIADALSHLTLPFVLVESDDRRVQQARAAGLPVIYGDASQPVVLEAAGVRRARAVLVTVPAFADVRNIVASGAAAPARSADHRARRRHRGRARALRARHPGGDVAGVRSGDRDDAAGADVLQRACARGAQRRQRDPARALRRDGASGATRASRSCRRSARSPGSSNSRGWACRPTARSTDAR